MPTPDDLQRQFMEWVRELDRFLAEEARLETRAKHFRLEALRFGFLKEMAPAVFLKEGFNRSTDEIHPFDLPTGLDRMDIDPSYSPPQTKLPEPTQEAAPVPPPSDAPQPPRVQIVCPACGNESFDSGWLGHHARWHPEGSWFLSMGSEITGRRCSRCGYLMLFSL